MTNFLFESLVIARGVIARRYVRYIYLILAILSFLLAVTHFLVFMLDSPEGKPLQDAVNRLASINPIFIWLTASLPNLMSVFYYRALILRNPWQLRSLGVSFVYAILFYISFMGVVAVVEVLIKTVLLPLEAYVPFITFVGLALAIIWVWLYVFVAFVLISSNYSFRLRESIQVIRKLQGEALIYVIFASFVSGIIAMLFADGMHLLLSFVIDIPEQNPVLGVFSTIEHVIREAIICIFMVGAYKTLIGRAARFRG